jgi:hypothetical protein
VAWAGLLGELHAVGLRPYLELEHGDHDDPLRLYRELDDELLLDVSLADEGLPDTPPAVNDVDWIVFVQAADGYLAEVMIEPSIEFDALAAKLRDLVDCVRGGARPVFKTW